MLSPSPSPDSSTSPPMALPPTAPFPIVDCVNFRPEVMNKRPEVMNFAPQAMNFRPEMANFQPESTSMQPEAVNMKLRVTSPEKAPIAAEPTEEELLQRVFSM